MSQHCVDCRFMTLRGCREDICGVVRAELRGRGVSRSFGALKVLAPEPLGPDGEAGLVIYGPLGVHEFPPTDAGYIAARAYQGDLEARGIPTKLLTLPRDLDIRREQIRRESERRAPVGA